MGWIKVADRNKPCRCRTPRIKCRYGDGSRWQCDQCSRVWELHRHSHGNHWHPYAQLGNDCGPTRPHVIGGQWCGGANTDPPRQTGTDWLYTEREDGKDARGLDWLKVTMDRGR